MDCPSGFKDKFGSNVCKLEKFLYVPKQSPRAWFKKISRSVKRLGYMQGQSDHTLFTRFSNCGKIAVLIGYADDIILTEDGVVEMERLKKSLAKEFDIKDLGALKYFLGMEVVRSKKGIVVSQRKGLGSGVSQRNYIPDFLEETGMSM